jgi:hypothetical protein
MGPDQGRFSDAVLRHHIQSDQEASKIQTQAGVKYYDDFAMLPAATSESIVFFGSRAYVTSFCFLTKDSRCEKTVFYNTGQAPEAPGCLLKQFKDANRDTNRQYDCANAFLDGAL